MTGIFQASGRTIGKITRRNWCFGQQPSQQKKGYKIGIMEIDGGANSIMKAADGI